jgi:indole-3-glycerol phosphate synthase
VTGIQAGTILDAILARTVADLATRKTSARISDLEAAARARPATRSLRAALAGPDMSVIAEFKRASPSRGAFPVTIDPVTVAKEYVAGGAAAISVLTDSPHFHGSLADLDAAAGVAHAQLSPVPVLRKDFVVDHYQIAEARAYGADAVLLIVAALEDSALAELLAAMADWRMDALVEVHDECEMERAAAVGAKVVGINNRDLKSFAVDLGVTERLAPFAPDDAVIVAESGVFGAGDVKRLHGAGAHAVLVGEGLITAPDRAAAIQALLAWPR